MSSVKVNGNPARGNAANDVDGEVDVVQGSNTIEIVTRDYHEQSVTNRYPVALPQGRQLSLVKQVNMLLYVVATISATFICKTNSLIPIESCKQAKRPHPGKHLRQMHLVKQCIATIPPKGTQVME